MAVFLYAPIMLQCMSPLVMLCTAPSPARECHESGCCLLQRMSPSLALRGQNDGTGFCRLLDQQQTKVDFGASWL
jgi:hypothetical protein